MDNRENILNNYYNGIDEDGRLIKDKRHSIEFIVTKNYIDKYLKSGDKVLEIGAGTGRYSLEYAKKGYDVTAIEYVNHNLDILKSKITSDMKIEALQGDAVDMSRYEDNTFDVTLSFGPLYHLFNDDDINKAIKEAIRVTKKGGIIMLAYISGDSIFADWGLKHLLDGKPEFFDDDFKIKRTPKGIFAPFYIDEFKDLMSKYDIEFLHNVATDGIVNLVGDKIDGLSDEEFEVWLKYQLTICERIDLQGYSSHLLYICKKK